MSEMERETEFLRRYEMAFQRFGVTTTVMYEKGMRKMLREYVAKAVKDAERQRDETLARLSATTFEFAKHKVAAEARLTQVRAVLQEVAFMLRTEFRDYAQEPWAERVVAALAEPAAGEGTTQ